MFLSHENIKKNEHHRCVFSPTKFMYNIPKSITQFLSSFHAFVVERFVRKFRELITTNLDGLREFKKRDVVVILQVKTPCRGGRLFMKFRVKGTPTNYKKQDVLQLQSVL